MTFEEWYHQLWAIDEAKLRRAIIRAFELDADAKPVVLVAPGQRWSSCWQIADFPEQERIYL